MLLGDRADVVVVTSLVAVSDLARLHGSWSGLPRTQPVGTITSLQSILSPPDPSADETARTPSAPSAHSSPKRKFAEAFSAAAPDQRTSLPPHPTPPAAPPAYHNHSIQGFVPVGGAVAGHGHAHDDRANPGFAVMSGADDKKSVIKRQPMRSSIACLRCRKSKIKCENDGGSSPCETCIKQGKDCKYPEATPLPPKRAEPATSVKAERESGPDRKRLKKIEDVSRAEGQFSAAAHAEDILSAHYLTPKLWSEVFDIYRLHFATELPFLHIPTLKEDMGAKFNANHKDVSPDTNLVLLGVLTLTARFHQDLVKYATHTASTQPGAAKSRPAQNKPDSSAASEFFAEALRKALGPLGTSMTTASVERVQAFLMLGLHEWSRSHPKMGGLGAWMYVGVAIRMAQALGLGFGDRMNPKSRAKTRRGSNGSSSRVSLPQPELMIAKEIKRRTMFSCLILDRLLSCGKERVSTIRSEDLQIQLPCNEWAFDLSKDVRTGFLKGPQDDQGPRDVEDDSVLSRFVRLVDLWGEISNFSFAGGRLIEEHPPWDPRNKFYELRQKLEAFYADLPSTFTLSTSNYHRHENHQASSVYVSLHMLGSVCQVMLHR